MSPAQTLLKQDARRKHYGAHRVYTAPYAVLEIRVLRRSQGGGQPYLIIINVSKHPVCTTHAQSSLALPFVVRTKPTHF